MYIVQEEFMKSNFTIYVPWLCFVRIFVDKDDGKWNEEEEEEVDDTIV